MKLISWNVNGLRAVLRKNFMEFLEEHAPDVLCLQEIKATPEDVELYLDGYQAHWHPATIKKGYSGTMTLTRMEPASVARGLRGKGAPEDNEGRVLTTEFEDFFLVNVYTPNSQRGLARLDFRTQTWDPAFRRHCSGLARKKPVIFCGDLNVAHREIDIAHPKGNEKSAGFTPEERASFTETLEAGFIDTFRALHPDETGAYTWWAYFARGAREKNIGWRIDYFCATEPLLPRVTHAGILSDVMGSDHAPVVLEVK